METLALAPLFEAIYSQNYSKLKPLVTMLTIPGIAGIKLSSLLGYTLLNIVAMASMKREVTA